MRASRAARAYCLLICTSQWACAQSVAGSNVSEPPRPSTVIGRAEIEQSSAATAEDAVLLLRRNWLSTARSSGRVSVRVYVDNVPRGGVAELGLIRVNQIGQMRYYNAREATTRWGTGHSGGVIFVQLRANSS